MRLDWIKPRRRIGLAEVYVGIGLSVLAAAYVLPYVSPTGGLWACPLYTVTDVPCLTCGFTRAFVRMAHLDPAGAFAVSPLGAMVFSGIAVASLYGLVRMLFDLPWPRPVLGRGEARFLRVSLVTVVIANWVYLVVRHRVLGGWG